MRSYPFVVRRKPRLRRINHQAHMNIVLSQLGQILLKPMAALAPWNDAGGIVFGFGGVTHGLPFRDDLPASARDYQVKAEWAKG